MIPLCVVEQWVHHDGSCVARIEVFRQTLTLDWNLILTSADNLSSVM